MIMMDYFANHGYIIECLFKQIYYFYLFIYFLILLFFSES